MNRLIIPRPPDTALFFFKKIPIHPIVQSCCHGDGDGDASGDGNGNEDMCGDNLGGAMVKTYGDRDGEG